MAWITAVVFTALIVGIVEPAKNFRWCAYEKEMKKCEDFVKVFPILANLTNVQGDVEGSCVKVTSDEDCMKKINNNEADLITLDGGKVYIAGTVYKLVPIVAERTESIGLGGLGYYGVAVAKVSNKNIKLTELKGKKTCHTGYRRTAGWILPIGYFLNKQKDFRTGCGDNIDAQSASKYFKESCVPGVPSGYDNLCALCPDKNCKISDNVYAGYHGAFRCMMDGIGDVAFVKHLTTGEVVGKNMSEYKYLCTDGTSKVVTNTSHDNCNLAQSKSHTVVGRAGDNKDIIKMLVKAGELCRPATKAQCGNFSLFGKYDGVSNLLFKDKAIALEDVGDKNTYSKWLGEYAKDVEAVNKKGDPCGSAPPLTLASAIPSLIFATFVLAKSLL